MNFCFSPSLAGFLLRFTFSLFSSRHSKINFPFNWTNWIMCLYSRQWKFCSESSNSSLKIKEIPNHLTAQFLLPFDYFYFCFWLKYTIGWQIFFLLTTAKFKHVLDEENLKSTKIFSDFSRVNLESDFDKTKGLNFQTSIFTYSSLNVMIKFDWNMMLRSIKSFSHIFILWNLCKRIENWTSHSREWSLWDVTRATQMTKSPYGSH